MYLVAYLKKRWIFVGEGVVNIYYIWRLWAMNDSRAGFENMRKAKGRAGKARV